MFQTLLFRTAREFQKCIACPSAKVGSFSNKHIKTRMFIFLEGVGTLSAHSKLSELFVLSKITTEHILLIFFDPTQRLWNLENLRVSKTANRNSVHRKMVEICPISGYFSFQNRVRKMAGKFQRLPNKQCSNLNMSQQCSDVNNAQQIY